MKNVLLFYLGSIVGAYSILLLGGAYDLSSRR